MGLLLPFVCICVCVPPSLWASLHPGSSTGGPFLEEGTGGRNPHSSGRLDTTGHTVCPRLPGSPTWPEPHLEGNLLGGPGRIIEEEDPLQNTVGWGRETKDLDTSHCLCLVDLSTWGSHRHLRLTCLYLIIYFLPSSARAGWAMLSQLSAAICTRGRLQTTLVDFLLP